MTELEQKVCDAFAKVADLEDGKTITLETRKEDLDLASLDIFELLMDFEDLFGTALEVERFSLCERVGDVCNEIEKQLSDRRAQ